MSNEDENGFETVIIEGTAWADTTTRLRVAAEPDSVANPNDQNEPAEDGTESSNISEPPVLTESSIAIIDEDESGAELDEEAAASEQTDTTTDPEFDALQALTALLVGGAIEGTSQLTSRLQAYQEKLRQEAEENDAEGDESEPLEEDELVRLRYALVGLIFDAQATLRRNMTLWAKLADRSASVTNRVTQPVTNSFLFGPARRRYNKLIRRGEESLARWIADGRIEEAPSRELARMTYVEIVDEFINHLAENPELQSLITQQSLSVAGDMRDEVRERTVTADNLMESLVRRVLRRTPRADLPAPPPEVQRWAGLSIEEYREQQRIDETNDESS